MKILIVSHNPLFSEVLAEMFKPDPAQEIICVEPEAAQEVVLAQSPQVIFVDEAIPLALRALILESARSLKKSKVILLTARGNDYVLIQSENLTFTGVDEFIRSLSCSTAGEIGFASIEYSTRMGDHPEEERIGHIEEKDT